MPNYQEELETRYRHECNLASWRGIEIDKLKLRVKRLESCLNNFITWFECRKDCKVDTQYELINNAKEALNESNKTL